MTLTVHNALSRAVKEETVEKLEKAFRESAVVYGMRFKNLSVKTMTDFRRSLPEGTKTYVCKNTLLKVAADKVPGWTSLKESAKGENAWVFVNEEAIAESVKAYRKFNDKLLEKYPKEKRKDMKPTEITGAVMDDRLLDMVAFKKLEKMPTKIELIATIARLLNQVPTKLAVSIKQVPTKLAYGVKALADGDENKEAVVSDIFPKPAAAASE